MTKEKLLIVVHHLGIGGGAEKIAGLLGKELHRRKYEVTFLTFYDRSPKYDHAGTVICRREKLTQDIFTKSFKVLGRARHIAKICKKQKIDTVISFLNDANFSTSLSKKVFFNPSKIVLSEQNNTLAQPKIFQSLVRWLYPRADLTVALSKGIELILNKHFDIKKTTTIYNMQDIEKFQEKGEKQLEPKKNLELFEKGFNFISIGRLSEQKSQKNMIKTFKLVVEKNPSCKLIILGDGKLKSKLQKLIKTLGLEENVYLLGVVDNVHPYLKKADCFVFTSQYEGFGNVVTEALTHNLNVISTDCKFGPREILCPELELMEKINYPYRGKYGTLIKTFNDKTPLKEVNTREYLKQERDLAEIMIKQTQSKKKKIR